MVFHRSNKIPTVLLTEIWGLSCWEHRGRSGPACTVYWSHILPTQWSWVGSGPADRWSVNVALSQVATRGRHKRWGLYNSTHVANPLQVNSINAQPSCKTLLFYDKNICFDANVQKQRFYSVC